MTSGSQPPGEVGRDAHSLIRLRERTEYPQLTDVPSDLRVNGARHASRESLPPSKPSRPQVWCVAAQVNSTRGRAAVRASAIAPLYGHPPPSATVSASPAPLRPLAARSSGVNGSATTVSGYGAGHCAHDRHFP